MRASLALLARMIIPVLLFETWFEFRCSHGRSSEGDAWARYSAKPAVQAASVRWRQPQASRLRRFGKSKRVEFRPRRSSLSLPWLTCSGCRWTNCPLRSLPQAAGLPARRPESTEGAEGLPGATTSPAVVRAGQASDGAAGLALLDAAIAWLVF